MARYTALTVQASLPVCHARRCQHPDIHRSNVSVSVAQQCVDLRTSCLTPVQQVFLSLATDEDCMQITYRRCGQDHMVHAFITSRVDYCNSILHRVSAVHVQPLQIVLNAIAWTILHK